MLSLYKTPKANQIKNTISNKQLSHICIDIKHTFGRPKR